MTIIDAVENCLTYWRNVNRIRETSAKTYGAILRRFAKHCGHEKAPGEVADRVHEYLRQRGAELGDHAFSKTFQVLRLFFEFSNKQGHCRNPLAQLRAPLVHETERVFLPEHSVYQLFEAVKDSGRENAGRDLALFAVLYFGLLRVGEAIRLRASDLDLEVGELLVLGKGGKQRRVPICENLSRILTAYLRVVPAQAPVLFPSRARYHAELGILDNARVEFTLREVYAPAAGLEGKVTPHTLRRSGADLLRRRGVDLAVIQRLLGHSSITTTLKYIGVSADELRSGVRTFDYTPLPGRVGNHLSVERLSHARHLNVKGLYR